MKYYWPLISVVVFFLPDPPRDSSDWQATATNLMHSSDLKAFRKKFRYQVLTPFDVFSDFFDIFDTVNISIELYAVVLNLHLFCIISMILNTYSAFTTEPHDGSVRNLVGM